MDRTTPSSDPELPEAVELPSRAVHVGRDCTGADHYLVPGHRVIVVRHEPAGDTVEHTAGLGHRSAADWVDYVAERRGWTVCTYDDRSIAALLFEPRIPQEALR